MMDDFIRPPKKEVKQETKQRPIKEVLIVILIIVVLQLGILQAMFQKRMLLLKIQMIAVLLMKFMIL